MGYSNDDLIVIHNIRHITSGSSEFRVTKMAGLRVNQHVYIIVPYLIE